MAHIGYWVGSFATSAQHVIADMVLTESYLQEILEIAINKGPEWLGSQMKNGEKRFMGRVLVYHSQAMNKAYEIYLANPIFEQLDPPVFQMYPLDQNDARFHSWYGDILKDDSGEKIWNFALACEMEEIIGKYVAASRWYRNNSGEIRKALNKTAAIKDVMEDPMS